MPSKYEAHDDRKRHIASARDAVIADLLNQGVGRTEIAKRLNIKIHHVHGAARRLKQTDHEI